MTITIIPPCGNTSEIVSYDVDMTLWVNSKTTCIYLLTQLLASTAFLLPEVTELRALGRALASLRYGGVRANEPDSGRKVGVQ